ncbi:MAG: hypothetical protein OEV49_01570 [candidate division Zixibacteria bacterium]|nr:hypothetical protein [candidate division Zixibacteria bacterium]MDH3935978.1 hypothetical protein [candidate division Zixibacteria bacterium]MDH4032704.1 hypothetical protein [candidate division Zixibacteria bacterium]
MTFVQLQLLIASTSDQTAEPAVFWSWAGIVAICAILIAAFSAVDWLLRRRHKDHILLVMSDLQDKLEHLPVKDWQVTIANAGIVVWGSLGNPIGWVADKLEPFYHSHSHALRVFARAGVGAMAMMGALIIFPFSERWTVFEDMPWYGRTLSQGLAAIMVGIASGAARIYEAPARFKPHVLRWMYVKSLPVFGISIVLTTLAALIGTELLYCDSHSVWFTCTESGIEIPTDLRGLTVLNFLFDLATFVITLRLLRLVSQTSKWFICAAIVDIAASAVLLILLHSILLMPTGGSVSTAWDWFIQVITFSASSTDPNWPLTPILFTTFIPVALYMSAFLFLGILVKPFARASAYLCGLMWEKEQTPFLVFALALSGMLTLTKAISEWRWVVDKLGG